MPQGFRLAIFILALLVILPITVFAHSGRTDSKGCHTNRKTGEYHCHSKSTKSVTKKARSEARVKARILIDNTVRTRARTSSPSSSGFKLQVHFIDVGQGDSILIDYGKNEILIDGGGKYSGIINYISPYVDGPLETIIATHPHADHIGGLIKVLDNFQVEDIWLNGDTSTSKTYQQFMTAVNSEDANVYEARKGGVISLDNLDLTILNPAPILFKDTNNNSIVLRLEYGNIVFLFTGDAEQRAEAVMIADGNELQAQILKAGHHCSKTSSSEAFLEVIKPKEAICMVGNNNRYGHPHQETLISLKEIGARVYRTDVNGTVIISTDGEKYGIRSSQ